MCIYNPNDRAVQLMRKMSDKPIKYIGNADNIKSRK